MRETYRAFPVSLGIHLLIIGMILFVSAWITPQRQIVRIDLSVEDTIREAVPPPPTQPPVAVKAPEPVRQHVREPTPAVHEVQAEKQAPLPEPVIENQEPVKEITAPVKQAAVSGGIPQPRSVESERTGYLKSQFFYIRDLVQKKAFYPKVAKMQGWEGQVMVSFIILLDGRAKDISVTKSSGKDVLDRSAMTAVRLASPFPKPPATVELNLPITYKLLYDN